MSCNINMCCITASIAKIWIPNLSVWGPGTSLMLTWKSIVFKRIKYFGLLNDKPFAKIMSLHWQFSWLKQAKHMLYLCKSNTAPGFLGSYLKANNTSFHIFREKAFL